MKDPIKFLVSSFNNPIQANKGGFKVEILDMSLGLVAETKFDVTLSSLSLPSSFETYDFNYVDTAASAQYATHQFVLTSEIPIQRGCRVKIIYPPTLLVTDRLITLTGSGFFEPPQDLLEFSKDLEENSLTLTAC